MEIGAAGDSFLRGFESCISGGDMGIQRRPYHKNCGCALHKARGHCSHSGRRNKVSYPIRRSWSEGCLTLVGQASPGCSPSATAAEAAPMSRTQTQLVLYEVEAEEESLSPKVISDRTWEDPKSAARAGHVVGSSIRVE